MMLPEDANPRVIVVKPEVPAPTPVRPNGPKASAVQTPYNPSLVCLLELATVIAIRDKETVKAFGKEVAEVLQNAIRDADHLHPVAASRLCYYIFCILKASNVSIGKSGAQSFVIDGSKDHDFLRAPVVLHHMSSFNQDLIKASAQNILKGLLECIKGSTGLRNEIATSPDFWSLLHSLRALPDGAALAFRIIDEITNGTPPAISADNYEGAVSLLNAFALAGGEIPQDQRRGQPPRRGRPQQQLAPPPTDKKPARSDTVLRGVQAMTLVQNLTNRVPLLIEQSHLEPAQAWQTYWHPIFRVLTTHCTNPCRDIRQAAFSSLHRCLLASNLASEKHTEWTNIFSGVLFPLIHQLLKPEVYNSDPSGMAETKLQASQALCKIFLHYLGQLAQWDGMVGLWRDILATMEALLKDGASGELVSDPLKPLDPDRTVMDNGFVDCANDEKSEALPESLKNILLVMSSQDLIVPPPDSEKDPRSDQQRELWDVTVDGLKGFLPGMVEEIFPAAAPKEEQKKADEPVTQGREHEKEDGNMPPASATPKLEQLNDASEA